MAEKVERLEHFEGVAALDGVGAAGYREGGGVDLCLRRGMKGEVEGQVVRGVSWDGEGKEGGVT